MPGNPGVQTLKPVTVIGGINIDIKGVSFGPLEDDTSNPGTVTVSSGGVGRNIAENLARLGVETTLLGAVGSGPFTGQILRDTADAGVDVRAVLSVPEAPSGVYLSLAGGEHRRFIALSDMRVTDHITPAYLLEHQHRISGCGMLVLDANLPPDTLRTATDIAQHHAVPVLLEPVSARKAERLKSLNLQVTYLTPNALEYRVLGGEEPDREHPKAISWAGRVYVTLGAEGVLKLTDSAKDNRVFPSPQVRVKDENGAGDAFTAGVVAGIIYGLSEDEALEAGIRAAVLTLQSERTVRPDLSKNTVIGGL